MSRLEISVCILLFSVFISSVSQILLKKAANRTYESPLKEYLNPLVIGAYGMFFCSVILTMLALKYVPLCVGDGILFSEREIYEEKAGRICTDPGRSYHI